MMTAELAIWEAIAKEIWKRVMSEDDPTDIREWALATITRQGGSATSAVMEWRESFDIYDALLSKRAANALLPADQRKTLDWPWESWNTRIDPLEPGMLGVISAPDGGGKTIYGESIAEHWAMHKNAVVFVHYELNRALMLDRRTARHTSLTVRQLKSGKLTAAQQKLIADMRPRLLSWDGYISYVDTPGWSMESTIAELRRLQEAGKCDAVVLDYLEKAQPSPRQSRYHMDWYQREADNVEQLKTFAESTETPCLMIAQMSKAGKGIAADTLDRNAMTGSADKSNRANVVVLLKRAHTGSGYSPTVDVVIDKNTMGPTGSFQQYMQAEFFRVGDLA